MWIGGRRVQPSRVGYVCDALLFRYATQSEDRYAHWTGVPVDAPTLHGRTMRAFAGLAALLALDDNALGTNPRPGPDGNRDCCSRSSSGKMIGPEAVVAVGGLQFGVEVLVTGRLRWAHVWPTAACRHSDQLVESVGFRKACGIMADSNEGSSGHPAKTYLAMLRANSNHGFGSAAFNSIR